MLLCDRGQSLFIWGDKVILLLWNHLSKFPCSLMFINIIVIKTSESRAIPRFEILKGHQVLGFFYDKKINEEKIGINIKHEGHTCEVIRAIMYMYIFLWWWKVLVHVDMIKTAQHYRCKRNATFPTAWMSFITIKFTEVMFSP